MEDVATLGALILAGGRARRMGRDKAMLVWRGRSLLDHARTLAQAVGADPVLVSGRADGLPDPVPGLGPAGGVLALVRHWQAAVDCLPARWLLLPVDMPALEPRDLAPLLAGGGTKAPVIHHEGRPLPALLHLSPAVGGVLAAAIEIAHTATATADGGRALALHRLWARLGARVLPMPQEALDRFVNLNTPAQWRAFLARGQ